MTPNSLPYLPLSPLTLSSTLALPRDMIDIELCICDIRLLTLYDTILRQRCSGCS